MPRRHRVTITEIASMCGVSAQTVSRVINNRPDVAPETRAAVQAAIDRTGFEPSAVARSLVHRRSRTLGVMTAGLHLAGVSQVLAGVADACERIGYALLLKELRTFEPAEVAPVVQFLAAHGAEGIIVDSAQLALPAAAIEAFVSAPAPTMVFLKSEPSPLHTTIAIDNAGGEAALTRHVLALGRRRIGYVAGPDGLIEARQRRTAWEETLAAAGLEPGPVWVGDWSAQSGAAALPDLLERAPALDAIIAANDQMAFGLIRTALQRGIRVPDDLVVAGFDGLPEGAYFTPSLTTVAQPLVELGVRAVQEVLAEVAGEQERGRLITLETELIIRDSAPALTGESTQTRVGVTGGPGLPQGGHQ